MQCDGMARTPDLSTDPKFGVLTTQPPHLDWLIDWLIFFRHFTGYMYSSTQTSKRTNHWSQLTWGTPFSLKQRLIKKTGYCTCTSTKIVFRVFFNLNIEEGNNSTYQELLTYHFVLVAAIATELRRRWHFDSLSMISASPAGAITRNSFNPYLKTNNNFRWSLRTLKKGSTLSSTYYHVKS